MGGAQTGGRGCRIKLPVDIEADPARHSEDLGLYAQSNRKTWEGLRRLYEL